MSTFAVSAPAGDQPHHQFDAFRTALPQIIDVPDRGGLLGRIDEHVHEAGIEVRVDETGARPLQLM